MLDHELTRPLHLLRLCFQDLEDLLDVDLSRDWAYVERRFDNEGLPFLSLTLPQFATFFQDSLDYGYVLSPIPGHFGRKGALPRFLNGLTSRVFDKQTGFLLEEPCYVSIFAVRQCTLLLSKYRVEPSEQDRIAALDELVRTDVALENSVRTEPSDVVLMIAQNLLTSILADFDVERIVPTHGPGVTAEGNITPWDKYIFNAPYLSEIFDETYFTGQSTDYLDLSLFDETGTETISDCYIPIHRESLSFAPISRVCLVPKKPRVPRIISAEPAELIYLQLGIGNELARCIANSGLIDGRISLKDQTVNQRKALQGSEDGWWGTIDWKEASDRISVQLCGQILPTRVMRVLEDCRSHYTELPKYWKEARSWSHDGTLRTGVLKLNKMSPMGNGYTFPLECLIFWTLTVACLSTYRCEEMGLIACDDTSITEWATHRCYVYGDDVIVPAKYAERVMTDLEAYGFCANRTKSFFRGLGRGTFRESCGVDAFAGVDVTPLKVKMSCFSDLGPKVSEAEWIASWYDMGTNPAYKDLLYRLCCKLKEDVYSYLGCTPKTPQGWRGCLGEPVQYDQVPGKAVKAGTKIKACFVGHVKSDGPNDNGVATVTVQQEFCAPSDGKLIKVWRIIAPSLTISEADLVGYSDEHALLRWKLENIQDPLSTYSEDLMGLRTNCKPPEYYERYVSGSRHLPTGTTSSSTRTFTVRKKTQLKVVTEFLS